MLAEQIAALLLLLAACNALLYPQQNEARDLHRLNELWTFVAEPSTACFECESVGKQTYWRKL